MKAARASLSRALDQPNSTVRFYLFHGPDEAGSHILADRLLKGLGAKRQVMLGQAIKADPANLVDEANTLSLFDNKQAIWVEPAGDEITEGVKALLDAQAWESPVIAIATSLRKTSSLLKLVEPHPLALSHASYVPEGRNLERMIIDLGSDNGLRIAPDLAQRIANATNSNQEIAVRELGKFALYLDASPTTPRELDSDTVDRLGTDSAEADLMRLGDLALAGKMNALLDELAHLAHSGSEAIPVLRALQRRLLMLAPLRARIDHGESINDVMASINKTLFWKDKPLVQSLISLWSTERLAEAVSRVSQLEWQIMLRPLTNDAALGEMLVTLARAARHGR